MIKQVIVMRKDLKMRKGKMIAQGAHASMKVFLDRGNTYTQGSRLGFDCPITEEMDDWINGIFTKICVYVNSEEELHKICQQARIAGIPHALIQDAGRTEFKEPTYTCCAIGPDRDEKVDLITGSLPLL